MHPQHNNKKERKKEDGRKGVENHIHIKIYMKGFIYFINNCQIYKPLRYIPQQVNVKFKKVCLAATQFSDICWLKRSDQSSK
jgi:hypothetical protein